MRPIAQSWLIFEKMRITFRQIADRSRSEADRRRRGRSEGRRFGEKRLSEAPDLQGEVGEVCNHVSNFRISFYGLQRGPSASPTSLFEALRSVQDVVGWTRVPQLVKHGTLDS